MVDGALEFEAERSSHGRFVPPSMHDLTPTWRDPNLATVSPVEDP